VEQNDIEIISLSWSMSLQCFVKCIISIRVCYQRHVGLRVITRCVKHIDEISGKVRECIDNRAIVKHYVAR